MKIIDTKWRDADRNFSGRGNFPSELCRVGDLLLRLSPSLVLTKGGPHVYDWSSYISLAGYFPEIAYSVDCLFSIYIIVAVGIDSYV